MANLRSNGAGVLSIATPGIGDLEQVVVEEKAMNPGPQQPYVNLFISSKDTTIVGCLCLHLCEVCLSTTKDADR